MRYLLFLLLLLLASPSYAVTIKTATDTHSSHMAAKPSSVQGKAKRIKSLFRNTQDKPLDKLAIWAICLVGITLIAGLAFLITNGAAGLVGIMLVLTPLTLTGMILGIKAWRRARKNGWKKGSSLAVIAVIAPVILWLTGIIGLSKNDD